MSDEEDVIYVKKHKSIHYGSLEEQERNRLLASINNENSNDESTPSTSTTENTQIHVSNGIKFRIFL